MTRPPFPRPPYSLHVITYMMITVLCESILNHLTGFPRPDWQSLAAPIALGVVLTWRWHESPRMIAFRAEQENREALEREQAYWEAKDTQE